MRIYYSLPKTNGPKYKIGKNFFVILIILFYCYEAGWCESFSKWPNLYYDKMSLCVEGYLPRRLCRVYSLQKQGVFTPINNKLVMSEVCKVCNVWYKSWMSEDQATSEAILILQMTSWGSHGISH